MSLLRCDDMEIHDARWFRVAIIVGAAALLMGITALASGGTSDPQEPAAAPGPLDSVTAEPTSGPQRTCLDGSRVARGARCGGLRSNEVMFAVAGVTESQCTQDTDYPWNAPGQSYACDVGSGELQVARYRDADAKAERVALYGHCARHRGGWQLCGMNPTNRRWVRTYVSDDLLMYTSSLDKDLLLAQDAISADVVLHGR